MELTMMSLNCYLRSSFKPDVNFVDDHTQDRLWGEWEHSRVRGALMMAFAERKGEWHLSGLPSLRVRVSETRVRVADICVIDVRVRQTQVISVPPVLVIEVKETTDELGTMLLRLRDFHAMGVTECWVFDPETKGVWVSGEANVEEWRGGVLRVAGTLVEVDPAMIFC